MLNDDDHVAAMLQGAAFLIAQLLIGYVWGHETVVSYLAKIDPACDKKKPIWKQPECCARAKTGAKEFFPLYWYWGNVRSSAVMVVLTIATTKLSYQPSRALVAALLILATNFILLHTSKQKSWNKS